MFDASWKWWLMLPSFVLKFNLVVIPMDHPLFAPAAIGSFVLGWLAREWSTYPPKLESVPCKCQCNCNTSGSSEVGWLGYVLVLVGCVLGCLLVCSNAALAFRFSYRDSESGKRHEFSVGVKGKKGGFGVYGVPKGLQLTEGWIWTLATLHMWIMAKAHHKLYIADSFWMW